MPVTFKETPNYVLLEVTEFVRPEEIVEAIETYFARHTPKHVVWDARKASFSSFTASQFEEVVRASNKFAEDRGPDAKTAVIARDEVDASVIKAYAGIASMRTSVAYKTFFDLESAEAWFLSA